MKTAYRVKKEKREAAIYAEYVRLMDAPGAMQTAVEAALMKKHHIHARSTIWQICQRVAKRQTTQPA